MPNVKILPPEIISKIAAGEVIERPASVIKELMENAIDADAQSIEISLKQAGKILINIRDTGAGIAQDDIKTIFHRHSTSKIRTIDDLFNIRSLGFRGEALYSIAAISDVTLRSKTESQDTGWEIHVRGTEQLDLRPVSMPTGTELEIKELFFNTPARRKFLKSNTTEMHQILNIFIPYALLYPEKRFLLKHKDKNVLDLNPDTSLIERIAGTLNLEKKHMLEASQDFPESSSSIHMILGDINIVRSRRDMQFIFINGRPVQNKSISFHLNNLYRLILPQGQCPFFALYIQLPAENIDANIHPTKREVKIIDEQMLCALLRQMGEHTLMTRGRPKIVDSPPSAKASKSRQSIDNTTIPQALKETHSAERGLNEPPFTTTIKYPQEPTEQYSFPSQTNTAKISTDYFPTVSENLFGKKQTNLQDKLKNASYIGSFINKYLIFESGQSLLVVDQHASQERITFEQLIKQMEKSQLQVQHLLAPYIIKLSPQQILVWEEAKELLEKIGFSSTQFDDETIAVHTHPALIKDPQRAVQNILSGENIARCDHETLARRACRASVMAGDRLNPQQAEYIRTQLEKCKDPFTCPHGRPTIIEMTENFLNKQFLRV